MYRLNLTARCSAAAIVAAAAWTVCAPAADTWLSVAPGGQMLKRAPVAARAPEVIVGEVRRDGLRLSVDVPGVTAAVRQNRFGRFVEIGWPDGAVFGDVGSPALPVIRKLLLVPDGTRVTLAVDARDPVAVDLDAHGCPALLYPRQAPVEKLPGARGRAPFDFDRAAYALDALLPAQRVVVNEVGIVRGYRLAQLEIRPVAYNPVRGELSIWPHIDVDVAFHGGRAIGGTMRSLPHLSGTLLNAPPAPPHPEPGNFLIVVADDFASGIGAFADFKSSQGYSVMTHSVASGTSAAAIKDYILSLWGGPDEPAYILLVGDTNTIPCWTGQGSGSPKTDLPYACMDGADDWYPDIAIGRFPVRSPQQLADVIDKTILFESGDYPDPDYVTRAVFMASEDNWPISEGTHNWVIENYLDPLEFASDKLYCHTYDATTQQVHDAFNDGRWYGIFSGHGSPSGWGDGPPFYQDDIEGLTNEGLYPFVCSFSCSTGAYDETECFTETWLLVADRGAAAVYGSSVSSYWDEDDILERMLFVAIYDDELGEISPAWQAAFVHFLDYFPPDDFTRRYYEMYNLMGDPSLRVVGEPEPGFALVADPSAQDFCGPGDAPYDIEVVQILDYQEPVTLSVDDEPYGMVVSFADNPVLPPATTTMTVSASYSAQPGDYLLEVVGTSVDMTRSVFVGLAYSTGIPEPVTLLSPPDGAVEIDRQPTLVWNPTEQAFGYDLEVATDPGFAAVVYAETVGDTQHDVSIMLDSMTQYWWRVRGTNACGEGEYSPPFDFTTLDQPDYFTESFASGDNDLDSFTIEFAPDGTGDYYEMCGYDASELPTDPSGGTVLSIGDDGYQAVSSTPPIPFYGQSYDTFYIGANGYVTFTGGDEEWDESLAEHFKLPRIAGLFDDLSPDDGGTLSWKELDDRVAVTWEDVPEWWSWSSHNTFQIEMFFDGEIHVTWLNIDAEDGIAGLSEGQGVPGDYIETDLSAAPPCGPDCPEDCTGDGVVDVLDLLAVLAAWGQSGVPADVNADGIVDVLDLLAVLAAWGPCE